MSVEMIDSVDAHRITGRPRLVAGYIDGDYAWDHADWGLPPVEGAVKVLISVTGDTTSKLALSANVKDVENGDCTPKLAADWIRNKHREGKHGCTVYCALSALEAVWDACRGEAYYIWVADWTGRAHPVPRTVATQYTNNRAADIDLSMVYSSEWVEAIDAANRPWPLAA